MEATIQGAFHGFDGNTIVKLMDGSLWRQVDGHYEYTYDYMPDVRIFMFRGVCVMHVDGVDELVAVERLR